MSAAMISGAGSLADSSNASSQPEYVYVHLVALGQFVVTEKFETLASFALVPVLWIVARDEIIQITPLQRIFLEREMQVGA